MRIDGTEKELQDLVYALAVAHEIATNYGKEKHGNPNHHGFVKRELEKLSEVINKELLTKQ